MLIRITLGMDLAAYAETTLTVPDTATNEEIIEAAREASASDDLVFDEDWNTRSDLRIVSARDAAGNYLIQDHHFEPGYVDPGVAVRDWLNGAPKGLSAVVDEAVRCALIPPPVMETYHGSLTVPGAEAIEVKFECRQGASCEEKDLAFLAALAQIAKIHHEKEPGK